MAYLVDTNCLARLANKSDGRHSVALQVIELHWRGEILHLTPQVLIEFRSIATRPIAQNGLGLSAVDRGAGSGLRDYLSACPRHTGYLSSLEGRSGWRSDHREASP